jgi:cytochrome c2
MSRAISLVLLLVIGLGLVAGSLVWTIDRRRAIETAEAVTGGNVERGEAALFAYGCIGCHSIPGVRLARGKVGPKLDDLRERIYIAGVLANTPDNLALWIQHPQWVDPKTAMPETGIGPQDARDVAAFLYSRR